MPPNAETAEELGNVTNLYTDSLEAQSPTIVLKKEKTDIKKYLMKYILSKNKRRNQHIYRMLGSLRIKATFYIFN